MKVTWPIRKIIHWRRKEETSKIDVKEPLLIMEDDEQTKQAEVMIVEEEE